MVHTVSPGVVPEKPIASTSGIHVASSRQQSTSAPCHSSSSTSANWLLLKALISQSCDHAADRLRKLPVAASGNNGNPHRMVFRYKD
jgi:hypothetical protein